MVGCVAEVGVHAPPLASLQASKISLFGVSFGSLAKGPVRPYVTRYRETQRHLSLSSLSHSPRERYRE